MMGSSAMGTKSRTWLRKRRLRMPKQEVSVPVGFFTSFCRLLLLTLSVSDCAGPVCKKMNDIRPNSIFLSSAFEPSPEELRMFARNERERSRLARERKPAKQERKPTPPKPKVAVRVKPEPEIVELSSDEELPDFSQILAGTKQEGASCDIISERED
jgi:hypothetical protein